MTSPFAGAPDQAAVDVEIGLHLRFAAAESVDALATLPG
jgi:hypothetical protein